MRRYVDGVQVADNGLGVWTGTLDVQACHQALWRTALTAEQIAALAAV